MSKTSTAEKPETASILPQLFWNILRQFASYRTGIRIKDAMILSDGYVYYCCPRCEITLDREFVSYCDRCGQKLDWTGYEQARLKFKNTK